MRIKQGIPARAEYPEIAAAAFPEEAAKTPLFFHCFANESPREAILSLNDPVGFCPSSLHHRFLIPCPSPYRRVLTRDVHPSPRDTMLASLIGGKKSRKCQIDEGSSFGIPGNDPDVS